MSNARATTINRIIRESVAAYFDEEGGSFSQEPEVCGISQIVDQIRRRENGAIAADALSAFIDNADGFEAGIAGGVFPQFVANVLRTELNDEFLDDPIPEAKAKAFAVQKTKEMFNLFKEGIMRRILLAPKRDGVNISEHVKAFLDGLQSQILHIENPDISDVHAYLEHNPANLVRRLFNNLGAMPDQKEIKSEEPVFVVEKTIKKIDNKLKDLISKLKSNTSFDYKPTTQYLRDYDTLKETLAKYRGKKLSADYCDFLIEKFGKRAKYIKAQREHIIAEQLSARIDLEGSRVTGINRLIDAVASKGQDPGSAEALRSFFARPSIDRNKHFTGVDAGGVFTQFVVNLVRKVLDKEFPEGIPPKEAVEDLLKEIYDLVREAIVNSILKVLPAERDISPQVKEFLDHMTHQLLMKQNPELYDLYAYLFFNPAHPLRRLHEAIGYAYDPKDAKQGSLKSKKAQCTAVERLEKIHKLDTIEKSIRTNNGEDAKAQSAYVSQYERLMHKLEEYQDSGWISEDLRDYRRTFYIAEYGTKTERLRAAAPKKEKGLAFLSFLHKPKDQKVLSPDVPPVQSPVAVLITPSSVTPSESSERSQSPGSSPVSSEGSPSSPPAPVVPAPAASSVLPDEDRVSFMARFGLTDDEQQPPQSPARRDRHRHGRRGSFASRFDLQQLQLESLEEGSGEDKERQVRHDGVPVRSSLSARFDAHRKHRSFFDRLRQPHQPQSVGSAESDRQEDDAPASPVSAPPPVLARSRKKG